MSANLENSAVAIGLEKIDFHSNHKIGQSQTVFKLPIVLISHASKVMLNILQARLQQYVNQELPEMQAGFRKKRQRNQRSNCQYPLDNRKSKKITEKPYFFVDYAKAFDCVDHYKLWKILKEIEYPTT